MHDNLRASKTVKDNKSMVFLIPTVNRRNYSSLATKRLSLLTLRKLQNSPGSIYKLQFYYFLTWSYWYTAKNDRNLSILPRQWGLGLGFGFFFLVQPQIALQFLTRMRHLCMRTAHGIYRSCRRAFSSPEAAILLVSTENHDLWPGPTTFRFWMAL